MASSLPTGVRGRLLALAMTMLLLAAAWLAVAAPLLEWHAARAERLEQRLVLAARMEGVAGTLPRLRQQAQGLPSGAAPSLLAGETDAIAGAALQGQLDRMASSAGLTLLSAELLPVEEAGAYRRVLIRLSVQGGWPTLIALLEAVAGATPRMMVDDLQIQAAPSLAAGQAQPVSATLTVLAFRPGGRG